MSKSKSKQNLFFTPNNILLAIVLVLCIFVFSVFCELYFEAYYNYLTGSCNGILYSSITFGSIARPVILFLLLSTVVLFFRNPLARATQFIIRYRFTIAVIALIILVIFEVSGSSISLWSEILSDDTSGSYTLLMPHTIRSDEYCVGTLLSFSQEYTNYSPISTLLRGTETQVDLTVGLATFSIPTLFRPSLWGYLILGSAKGISFAYFGRLIALLLVTYDFSKIVCKKSSLSLAFALLITFSPIVQWWDTGDLILYGEGLVICLYQLLNSPSKACIIAALILLPWLAGCYFMVLYPAWMVPLFYLYALMGVWIIVENVKKRRNKTSASALKMKVAFPVLALLIVAVFGAIAYSFVESSETLATAAGTVYPGSRFETGGGTSVSSLLAYGASLFFPISQNLSSSNVCESSMFFSLFPLGFFLGFFAWLKTRDLLTCLLMVLQIFYLWFSIVGVPPFLAKITLLSNVPPSRLVIGIGLVDICLLARSIYLFSHSDSLEGLPSSSACLLIPSGIMAILACACAYITFPDYMSKLFLGLLFVFTFTLSLTTLAIAFRREHSCEAFCIIAFMIAFCGGMLVHPIQIGATPVTGTALANNIQEIVSSDEEKDDLWIVEQSWLVSNYCVANGASVLSSTNIYPNMETWHLLDPTGQYEDVYNRYAHIIVTLTDDSTNFKLIQPDLFNLDLNYFDLTTLGIDILVTKNDYTNAQYENITLILVSKDQNSGYNFYRIEYA